MKNDTYIPLFDVIVPTVFALSSLLILLAPARAFRLLIEYPPFILAWLAAGAYAVIVISKFLSKRFGKQKPQGGGT